MVVRISIFKNLSVCLQISDKQFLVEFALCKHGKFSDTEYQETFVYDIVSHADALRRPVMVDDTVLAPWEPQRERYAPAVVISGLEKRMAAGTTIVNVITCLVPL